MFSLAAAHPEAFTDVIDCYLRSPVVQAADMVAAVEALAHAAAAVVGSRVRPLGALDNTAAVAGLASAVASFSKRTAQLTRAAATLQQQPAAATAQGVWPAAAAYFPTALTWICTAIHDSVTNGLLRALRYGSSSSSSSQVPASIALLAVVLARSLVQLADAMEAVGPQLLFECLEARPSFEKKWSVTDGDFTVLAMSIDPWGSSEMHNAPGQWQIWQVDMLQIVLQIVLAFIGNSTVLSAVPGAAGVVSAEGAPAAAPAGVAAEAGAVGPAAVADFGANTGSGCGNRDTRTTGTTTSSSCTTAGSSSSATQQVSWSCLLRMQQASPRWAAAVAAFDAKWPGWRSVARKVVDQGVPRPISSEVMQQLQQQYTDTLELCRVLVAAAPLPLLCNNPGCDSLARVSEAAAASKRCAGCHCHYCSVECQRADWKRHKHACKSMAAAGLACV
jgi:hypothetical protein